MWLTDLVASSGVESLEYLVHYKGDVTTILKQDDLLDLCEKVLKVSKWILKEMQGLGQGIITSCYDLGFLLFCNASNVSSLQQSCGLSKFG